MPFARCARKSFRAGLYDHIGAEHAKLRENTIQVIQAYYPGWSEERGACENCWKSYRDAGRILSLLKAARPRDAAGSWTTAAPLRSGSRSGQTSAGQLEKTQ